MAPKKVQRQRSWCSAAFDSSCNLLSPGFCVNILQKRSFYASHLQAASQPPLHPPPWTLTTNVWAVQDATLYPIPPGCLALDNPSHAQAPSTCQWLLHLCAQSWPHLWPPDQLACHPALLQPLLGVLQKYLQFSMPGWAQLVTLARSSSGVPPSVGPPSIHAHKPDPEIIYKLSLLPFPMASSNQCILTSRYNRW